MKKIILLTALLFMGYCVAESGDSEAIKVYPNPYDPNQGYLTIEQANGTALTGTRNQLIVYDYLLSYEVFNGDLATGKYAGVDSAGEKLVPGIYFLKVIQYDNAAETVVVDRFRLVVK